MEELKEVLQSLPDDLSGTGLHVSCIEDPKCIVDRTIHHRWEEGGIDRWYEGIIKNIENNELKVLYHTSDEPFFMTLPEFLTDLYLEDVVLV